MHVVHNGCKTEVVRLSVKKWEKTFARMLNGVCLWSQDNRSNRNGERTNEWVKGMEYVRSTRFQRMFDCDNERKRSNEEVVVRG